MSLKKTYVKSKNICRVTFNLADVNAAQVAVVGDFNSWNEQATPMKKSKTGFSATVDLEPGREYQFRYLVDGQQWCNDDSADHYCETPFSDAHNGIIRA